MANNQTQRPQSAAANADEDVLFAPPPRTQHPFSQLSGDLENDNVPEMRDIPRIRDNPQMAATTAKRRSSVAHPQSIKYRDPGVSIEETSSEEEEDDDDESAEHTAHSHHANDPSISDLNEATINAGGGRLNPHFQPMHALRDGDEVDDDNHEEDDDPFARLGNKQKSVAHPLITPVEQQRRQIKLAADNPYSPQSQLPARHLQQRPHSRHKSVGFMPPQRPKSSRRHHSSSMDFNEQMLAVPAPSGPDLTFICMRIENRSVLQSSLSPQQYTHLLDVFRSILTDALQQYRGFSIEQHSENVYDAFVVFDDVYNAVRCAIHIQTQLHTYQWPQFYYELEQHSQRMAYVGTGATSKDAFNGLRVGMSLHTATAGTDVNKYDGGRETLSVSTLMWTASYTGTAVELSKHLCLKSYGGELLCTKALYQALLQCKKLGDEVSVQRLGACSIDGVRQVELIDLIPRDLPARQFPSRTAASSSVHNASSKRKSVLAELIGGDEEKENGAPKNYDPFPITSNGRATDHKDKNKNKKAERQSDDTDSDSHSSYNTMNEVGSDGGDGDDSVHSHSSKDHEVQHHPRISQRRPSLTVINLKQNSKIEVTFNGGEDDDELPLYDDDTDRHQPAQAPSQPPSTSSHRVPPPTSSDAHLLNVDRSFAPNLNADSDMHSDHSIDPPKQHTTRNKTQEIKRRKSLANNEFELAQHFNLQSSPEATPQLTTTTSHNHDDEEEDDEVAQLYKQEQRRKRNKKKKKQKLRKQRSNKPGDDARLRKNGHFGDDETTPLPADSDSASHHPHAHAHPHTRIQKPKPPRVDKKRQYKETLVNIEYDAAADDVSSVYSAGSRSLRTSRTAGSNSQRMLHPHQQLRLYKVRPPSLPEDYSDDKEFTCLCCQNIKFWLDGVWRVPMWPSFDVCVECANKELQSGTSKKHINYDPTGMTSGALEEDMTMMTASAAYAAAHQRVPSNQPLRKYNEHNEEMTSSLGTPKDLPQHSTRLNQDTIELIRKELSSMIEKLTNEKMTRLENLIKWAENDGEFTDWRRDRVAERKTTEDELSVWRKKAHRLDEQERRLLRRQNTVSQTESPTASDLGSDEELTTNWQDYDIQEDFSTIDHRLNELDGLFWSEDQFYKTKFKGQEERAQKRLEELEQKYIQTTMNLQQSNQALEGKIQDMLQQQQHGRDSNNQRDKPKDYNNLINNNVDIDEYSSDDLNNEQMGAYEKYVPPRVRHIHESSRQLPAMNGGGGKRKNKHDDDDEDEDEDEDPFASDDDDDVVAATDEHNIPVQRYKEKIKELDSTIDNYISILNRKTAQLQETQRENDSLKQQLEQDPTQARMADLYNALQRANDQNAALQQKLKLYMIDEASQQHLSPSDNNDSHSTALLFEPFAESHDVDARTQQENEARLQQAKQQVDDLEQELKQQRDEMEREKMELINRTSTQIEMMRDELQTMCQHLQHKERTIHKLVHINREGYVPENDDFKYNASETQQQQQQQQQPNSDSRSSSLWSTAIRNGISSLTFARSKFSTPVHTLTETKQSKTDLAISSSREIDRLRSIIRTLSTKQTNAGPIRSSNLQNGKSALIDAEYEEVYPGGASN